MGFEELEDLTGLDEEDLLAFLHAVVIAIEDDPGAGMDLSGDLDGVEAKKADAATPTEGKDMSVYANEIAMLTDMGFTDLEAAFEALSLSSGDVGAAATRLSAPAP